jgi:hypothetical protein
MYDYCKTILLLFVVTTLVKLPEDEDCAETRSSKLIVKYIKYRIVHLLVLIVIVNQLTVQGKFCTKGTQIFVPALCSEVQGQAVTAADGVSVVGEVKTSGDFNCISLTFRNNWLLANATPFSNQSQGRQNHQSTPHASILIRNSNECTFDT